MKRLTALAAAAAVALAGAIPAPAAAKSDGDKALLLLLGAAALGYALHQQNRRHDRPAPPPMVTPQPWPPIVGPRPIPQPGSDWRKIPDECVFDVHTDAGRRDVVSGRCVTELTRITTLPQQCAFDIYTSAGKRSVYGTRCLTDYGYRIEGTRHYGW
jgi:hypothetical protein